MSDQTATADAVPQDERGATPRGERGDAPEHGAPRRARQWVSMRNASLDLRVGADVLDELPRALRASAGRPHACALVHAADASAPLVRELRENLEAEGFEVRPVRLPIAGCSLEAVCALDAELARARVTADDMVVALGGASELSVASYACASWCGGVPLAEVPTELSAAVVAAVTPSPLDVAGQPRMVAQEGSARFLAVDEALMPSDPWCPDALLARALMAQTAACDSDKTFGALWDDADALLTGDRGVLAERCRDAIRARGKVAASASAATRKSLEFGTTFARVLRSLAPGVDPATALADGMRFASRVSVGQGTLEIDDMLTIDELLERLGLPTARVSVSPEALASGLREERYRRTNRFMLAVPRAVGRVRLAVVTDELLSEHAAAWCASRPVD